MPLRPPLTELDKVNIAAHGVQDFLVLVGVPAAAADSLRGTRLDKAGALSVSGNYTLLVPLAGQSVKNEVHLKATFGAGVVTVRAYSTFADMASVKTAYANDNTTLATTVLKTFSLTTFDGAQYALITVTLDATAAAAGVTFTQAEYNGI